MFKWIGGLLGLILYPPYGAFLGFLLGYVIDSMFTHKEDPYTTRSDSTYNERVNMGQRNQFLNALLLLTSYIIRADGKIMHSEMEFVRTFLRSNFSEEVVQEYNNLLLQMFEEAKFMNAQDPFAYKKRIRNACIQIAMSMDYSMRLQLLNYLVLIAKADGRVTQEELAALYEVAGYMGVQRIDVDSLLNLSSNSGSGSSGSDGSSSSTYSLENDYKVLGGSPDASDEEVKAAYRKLALKHHPDRVSSLGDDVRAAAEKKFQEINNAKERIYKARGL